MASLSNKDGVENIMFLLLNIEEFENAGPTFLLYYLENDHFPLSLDMDDTNYLANGTLPTLDATLLIKFSLPNILQHRGAKRLSHPALPRPSTPPPSTRSFSQTRYFLQWPTAV